MNLIMRVLSALILLPIVVYLILAGGSFLEFATIFIVFISSFELCAMAYPLHKKSTWLFSCGGALFFAGLLHATTPTSVLLLVMALCGGAGILSLVPNDDSKTSQNPYFLVFSLCYVAIGIASMVFLRRLEQPAHFGRDLFFLLLIVVWANDIFAYFFGKAFGKHKLAEKISNSKTWEGFIAGASFGIATPIALWWCLAPFTDVGQSLTLPTILAIGISGALFGPLGDLVESRMKRIFGVKDSGTILPGHGGILDRIDALLLLAPWTLAYAIIFCK